VCVCVWYVCVSVITFLKHQIFTYRVTNIPPNDVPKPCVFLISYPQNNNMSAARYREPIATLATHIHADRSCGNVPLLQREAVIGVMRDAARNVNKPYVTQFMYFRISNLLTMKVI
jgi:hypothetical protein